jgi:hypothetical protein
LRRQFAILTHFWKKTTKDSRTEPVDDAQEFFWKSFSHFHDNLLGDLFVESLRNSTCNAGQGVTVPAKGNSLSHRVFIIL